MTPEQTLRSAITRLEHGDLYFSPATRAKAPEAFQRLQFLESLVPSILAILRDALQQSEDGAQVWSVSQEIEQYHAPALALAVAVLEGDQG